jgi:GNAT superfamily N-acetyltransferase
MKDRIYKPLKKSGLPWIIRSNFNSEDIDYLTRFHGVIYAREYGYDQTFEAYVFSGLAEFVRSFDSGRDRIWLAECDGHIIGAIAVVGCSKEEAQLRWFLVQPEYRGLGLGKKLIAEALLFCKKHKYRTIFLWTTSELDVARHLYTGAGFRKTEEETHEIWGKKVSEERYELQI